MSTLDDTLKMLEVSRIPRRIIAEETGLGLDWLNKLAQGGIGDPGIRRITRLHDYLMAVPPIHDVLG